VSKGIEGHFSECVKDAGLHHDRASFETRPSSSLGQASRAGFCSFYDHDGVCRAGEFVWHHIGSFTRPIRTRAP